jgi:hypothetical protein
MEKAKQEYGKEQQEGDGERRGFSFHRVRMGFKGFSG